MQYQRVLFLCQDPEPKKPAFAGHGTMTPAKSPARTFQSDLSSTTLNDDSACYSTLNALQKLKLILNLHWFSRQCSARPPSMPCSRTPTNWSRLNTPFHMKTKSSYLILCICLLVYILVFDQRHPGTYGLTIHHWTLNLSFFKFQLYSL